MTASHDLCAAVIAGLSADADMQDVLQAPGDAVTAAARIRLNAAEDELPPGVPCIWLDGPDLSMTRTSAQGDVGVATLRATICAPVLPTSPREQRHLEGLRIRDRLLTVLRRRLGQDCLGLASAAPQELDPSLVLGEGIRTDGWLLIGVTASIRHAEDDDA
jgi:hypothetical protein